MLFYAAFILITETILENPALFSGKDIDSFDISHEYLDICEKIYPTAFKYIRTHLLQILKKRFQFQFASTEGITITLQIGCIL